MFSARLSGNYETTPKKPLPCLYIGLKWIEWLLSIIISHKSFTENWINASNLLSHPMFTKVAFIKTSPDWPYNMSLYSQTIDFFLPLRLFVRPSLFATFLSNTFHRLRSSMDGFVPHTPRLTIYAITFVPKSAYNLPQPCLTHLQVKDNPFFWCVVVF